MGRCSVLKERKKTGHVQPFKEACKALTSKSTLGLSCENLQAHQGQARCHFFSYSFSGQSLYLFEELWELRSYLLCLGYQSLKAKQKNRTRAWCGGTCLSMLLKDKNLGRQITQVVALQDLKQELLSALLRELLGQNLEFLAYKECPLS